ncbi:MAG: hypothetical protein ACREO1_13730 [Arenimonas sp.]
MFRIFITLTLAALLQLSGVAAFAQTSDTAKVVFYRSSQDSGGKTYALTTRNQQIAKLKKGEKFEQNLAPGTYYYMADPSTKHVLKLEVQAGQTYYVRAGRDDDYFDGQPSLRLTSVQEYQQALAANN